MQAALPSLEWQAGGTGPGQFAMISGEQFSDEMTAACEPVFEAVLSRYEGRRRGVTMLSKLVPGQRIEPHRDGHDGGCKTRIHVPLVTNDRCRMKISGEDIFLPPGYAVEIDPTEEHSVWNGGEGERVHLIFNCRE